MKIRIVCKCGSSFEIGHNAKQRDNICCPNCGKNLPGEASSHVLAIISHYNNAKKELENNGPFDIKVME